VDAIFPVYGNYSIGESAHMMISDTVVSSTMTLINNRTDPEQMKLAAVCRSDPFQIAYVQINFPDTDLLYCDSMEECINAVVDDQADFTLAETSSINEWSDSSFKYRTQVVELQNHLSISFAVERGSRDLLAVLNKGIRMGASQISTSMMRYSQTGNRYTIMAFLREHILQVLLLLLIVFSVIIGMLVAYIRLTLRSKKRLNAARHETHNARWKADHDSLTGLLNRSAFQEIADLLKDEPQSIALLLFDVDNFKDVNDKFGHSIGDQALVKVANLLSHSFRERDYVIRYAGDEFIVLMLDIAPMEHRVIDSKIQTINHTLLAGDDSLPAFSISAGVVFSENGYSDQLFEQADQALYEAKEHGRCGYSIYNA
jgi:diguanylate cyclase (GGDEF)-like protein